MDFNKRPGGTIKRIGELENDLKPTISIITPFYNGGKTLNETANSIFNQTYPFFEWIIIDDGSTDKNSLNKLEELSKIDSRIRVLHKENGGPSQARDFGISKSSEYSKYIYFLDCDDIIENTALEIMYWTLETHKEASFAYPSIINFGDLEYYWEPYFTLEEEIVNNIMCISTMVRKEDLLEVGCFGIKEKAMYEDWNLWLKLLAKGKIPIRINAKVFWYRNSNTGELSRSKNNHERAIALINHTVKTIKNDVEAIQFPRLSSSNPTKNSLDGMTLPKYKKEDDNTILFILPEMVISKRSIFDFEFIKRLSQKGYNCIVITTDPVKDNIMQDILEYVTEFYNMTNFLDLKDYPLFVDYLINSRNISSIFIDNSPFGYALLPYIKDKHKNVKIIDYIKYEDLNGNNIIYTNELDKVIDMTFTDDSEVYAKLGKKNIRLLGNSNPNIKLKNKKYDVDKIREEYNITNGKKIVSFIDRISYEECPMIFLKVAQILLEKRNDVSFIISGNGPMYDDIEREINRLNLNDDVYIIHQLDNSEKLYAISDLVIKCSLNEGVNLSSYKALSMGVPVIVSDVGKQYELITNDIGRVVKTIKHNGKIKLKEQSKDYVSAVNDILDNLKKYKENVSNKMIKYNVFLDDISSEFIDILNDLNVKKCSNENFPLLVYSYYLEELKTYFKELYITYYKENLYIIPKEQSDFIGLLKIKKKFRTISIKYGIENEMQYIFASLKNVLKMAKSFIKSIEGFIIFIIRLLPTIFKTIHLSIRIIKVLLVKLKRKIIKNK